VASKLVVGAQARVARIHDIKKNEIIGDIGPETMRAWAAEIKKAKTIVWNGPLGVAEIPTFSHGSLVIARAIATQSKGRAFGVVGGGEALSVALASGMCEWYDYISTGGGALLTYIATKGKLPGLLVLQHKKS
jgi:phosphoglycerate kinase